MTLIFSCFGCVNNKKYYEKSWDKTNSHQVSLHHPRRADPEHRIVHLEQLAEQMDLSAWNILNSWCYELETIEKLTF